MNKEYQKMPGIFLDMAILRRMVCNLSDCEVGNIIRCLFQYFQGEEEFKVTPTEVIYLELLSDVAKIKADKWLNQTSNFRNNNPRKKTEEKHVEQLRETGKELDSNFWEDKK